MSISNFRDRRSHFSALPLPDELLRRQLVVRDFFGGLRDDICGEFELIESDLGRGSKFVRESWDRSDSRVAGGDGGGGEMSVMSGDIFEKVGVNISTVSGYFSDGFGDEVAGASGALGSDGYFWASGISVVAHMMNPHVPAVHMNLRMVCTGSSWFGGGIDMNSAIPSGAVVDNFRSGLRGVCDSHDGSYYDEFSKWCDEYFYLPHRDVCRGDGGIFYDYLDSGDWELDFAFHRDVGLYFLGFFPSLFRGLCGKAYGSDERHSLFVYRGRYAEFNLLYDRGTRFGLRTGGNIDAILMSLPPVAVWE